MIEPDSPTSPAAGHQESPRDRRVAIRYESNQAAACFLFPTNERIWATVLDVSTTGIGLLASREFPRDTQLLIEVTGPGPRLVHPLSARVAHVTAHSCSSWIIGCEFTTKLSEDEVRSLL